jgi:hypothetical protein
VIASTPTARGLARRAPNDGASSKREEKRYMPRSIHSRPQIGQGRAPSEQRPWRWWLRNLWRAAFQRPAAEHMAGTSAAEGALDLERQLLDAQQLASLGMLAYGIAHDFTDHSIKV